MHFQSPDRSLRMCRLKIGGSLIVEHNSIRKNDSSSANPSVANANTAKSRCGLWQKTGNGTRLIERVACAAFVVSIAKYRVFGRNLHRLRNSWVLIFNRPRIQRRRRSTTKPWVAQCTQGYGPKMRPTPKRVEQWCGWCYFVLSNPYRVPG